MAGISSRALAFGAPPNKEKTFQGQRFDDELSLNWVQFKWRNHDPQIGRFIEVDPLSEKYKYNGTYVFSENKVIAHIELEGLEAQSLGTPQGWLVSGFRDLFSGWGSAISFKAEAHINYENNITIKSGSAQNTIKTDVVENKVELKTNFGEYFRTNGGVQMIKFSAGRHILSKVENKTEVNFNAGEIPMSISSKTTVSDKGTEKTFSIGPKLGLDFLCKLPLFLDHSKLEFFVF